MKFSPSKNKLVLPKVKEGCCFTRHVVLLLFTVSLMFSPLVEYSIPHAFSQEHAPLNLVSDLPQDVNGFEFNPKWAWQLTNAGFPDPNQLCFKDGKFGGCTTDKVDFDEPRLPNSATCVLGGETSVKGHINWRPATYMGRINWGEFSTDGDYCFEFAPPNNNGLTTNRQTLHVEFAASETIRHFNTPWWKEFRKSVGIRKVGLGVGGIGKTEQDFVNKFVNGKRAIVIGLLNLDCVHGCYTELHPVYALAINTETKVNPGNSTVDEVWTIFARNWGNEGWCSQNQHYLNLETNSNKLSLVIPWGPDTTSGATASSYEVLTGSTKFFSNSKEATGPEVSIAGTQGILVSFSLPKAKDKARIHGELHLRWVLPKDAAGQPSAPVSPSVMSASSTNSQEAEVEERLLYNALGEEGRSRVASENEAKDSDTVPQRVRVRADSPSRNKLWSIFDKMTQVERIIIQPEPPAQPPKVESEFDPEKAERDKRLLGTSSDKP